jgi:hypothetical protein
MRAAAGAITTSSYYNSAFYYSRTVAVSGRRSMLFSSGDSLRTLSSILSGEGLDEREQRESPLSFHLSRSKRTITVSIHCPVTQVARSPTVRQLVAMVNTLTFEFPLEGFAI